MENEIRVIENTQNTFYVHLHEDGEPYTLSNGEKLIFVVKADWKSRHASTAYKAETIIRKVIESGAEIENAYPIEINSEDTRSRKSGIYWYSVVLKRGNENIPIIGYAPFIIEGNGNVGDYE